MSEKLIRIKTVIDLTGKSRSSIYADIASNKFPKPLLIGARAVAWQFSAIQRWIQSKIDLSMI